MRRRFELDSLRGMAALSVLLYHALALNSDQLTAAIQLRPVDGVLPQLLAYSPLHLFWLGGESVWLFFVLSGFVLTRLAQTTLFSWQSYYPSRVLRLYLPVAAAIVLAWLTYTYPHVLTPTMDQLLPTSYPPPLVLQDLLLVGGTSTSLGVLWSLQWEVIFSLALPLYLLVGRRWPVLSLVSGLILCVLGWKLNVASASYLPMFLIGVVLATHWNRVVKHVEPAFAKRFGGAIFGAAALVVGCAGMLAYYLLGPSLGEWSRAVTVPITLGAITLLIVVVQMWSPLSRVLSMPPFRFLGRASYSLYLVHMPIVVLFLFVLKPGVLSAAAGVLVSLLVAVVFYYVVERPAHRFAQRTRKQLTEATLPQESAAR